MMSEERKINSNYYYPIVILVLIFLIYTLGFIWKGYYKSPTYMVIINPAHGGHYAPASEKDGDRYDPVNRIYTREYQEGNVVNQISEYKVLADLSKKINERLSYTKDFINWGKFEKILIKYGRSREYKRIILIPKITKEHDYQYYQKKGKKDINRYFRLFDYPSKNIFKKLEKGILSFINIFKPEIVLNLDFNYLSKDDREIFSVTVPHIRFFNYIREKLINKDIDFRDYQSVIGHWYGKDKNEKLNNLIAGTWVYFTGTYPDITFFAPSDKFLGLAYNAVEWRNKDRSYPRSYSNKKKNPQYYPDLKDFKLNGTFWKREQNNMEKYKRLEGDYGMGDNEYIGEEISKYIISVLNVNKDKDTVQLKKSKGVYNYDDISLHVNSLVININLGSIREGYIQNIYTRRIEDIADAVCIGLYSICQGYDLKKPDNEPGITPIGKSVDFNKYYKYHYINKK